MQTPQSIGSVERETGLSKDTLRVWERRYRFPQPIRDDFGERAYPADQIAKLRLLKRLLDCGYRPGKIVHFSSVELQDMVEKAARADIAPGMEAARSAQLQDCLALCGAGDPDELRRTLVRELIHAGLQRFVLDIMAPLTTLVGDAWARGDLAVYQEHLYSESVQMVMRHSIASLPRPNLAAAPRVLLTTLPREQHGLGLLMAEAILTIEGAFCIPLGTQTPIAEIVRAAEAQKADIVAVSVSSSMNANQALDGLTELRNRLPESTGLWAGGRNAVLARRPPTDVLVLDLQQIAPRIKEWHASRQAIAAD
jgi:DNA-binding transcriptional MerR regulator/methylmalonyl-CoA mutase cobalamin-binding subunit